MTSDPYEYLESIYGKPTALPRDEKETLRPGDPYEYLESVYGKPLAPEPKEEPPQEKQPGTFTQSANRIRKSMQEGAYRAAAGYADLLRGASKIEPIGKVLGQVIPGVEKPRGEAQQWLKRQAEDARREAERVGIPEKEKSVADIFYSRGTELAGSIPKYALEAAGGPVGFAAGAALEAKGRDEKPSQIAAEAAQGAYMGKLFQAVAPLARMYRMPTMAVGMGAPPAIAGAPKREVAEAAITGGFFGVPGRGRITPRELYAKPKEIPRVELPPSPAEVEFQKRRELRQLEEQVTPTQLELAGREPIPMAPPGGLPPAGLLPERAGPPPLLPEERMPPRARAPEFVAMPPTRLRTASMVDLVRFGFGEEIGQVGKFTPEQLAERAQRREARYEIRHRVAEYAKEKEVTLDKAMEELGLRAEHMAALAAETERAQPIPEIPTPIVQGARREGPLPLIAGTRLKTGEFVEGRLAYNPEKINAPEDVTNIFKDVSARAGEFREQRIKKTDESIRNLAEEVGLTPDDLLKTSPGSIANAETVLRARQVNMTLAQDLRDYVRSVDLSVATPEQMAEFNRKYFRLLGTMKAVAGFRTESSNLFRQFKQKVSPQEQDILREVAADVKRLDATAGENLSQFTRGVKELSEPTLADKGWHLWYSSILSGWSTHLKNAMGNMTQFGMELARVGLTNPKEFPTALRGGYLGLIRGAEKAGRILKEGEFSKFQERGLQPIVFKGKARILNAADYVGRALSATDAFFREGFKGMEAHGIAREQALREGYKGEALKARITELAPEKLLTEEVEAFGRRGAYMQRPTGILGALSDAASGLTGQVPVARLVVPFTRVVANVVNNGLDWTPVGLYRAALPKGLIAGRLKGRITRPFEIATERQRYQEIGRGVLGTLAMAWFAYLAAEEKLTGNGPLDWRKKKQWMDAGNRPNSIKILGRSYPYMNWGPIAIPMALVGNYFDAVRYGNLTEDQIAERLSAAMIGSVKSIIDMSFLRGISELMEAIQDWRGRGTKYLVRFPIRTISAVVPNFVKQTARIFDPTVYEQETIREILQNSMRITTGLQPQLNVFGEVVKGDIMTQLQPVKKTTDPLKRYLVDNNLWISVPSKTTTLRDQKTGEKRPMMRDEYRTYIRVSGQEIYKALTQELSSLQQIKDPEEAQDKIDRIVKAVRKQVKMQIQFGEIRNE